MSPSMSQGLVQPVLADPPLKANDLNYKHPIDEFNHGDGEGLSDDEEDRNYKNKDSGK